MSIHRACCCGGNVCTECPDLLPSTLEITLAGLDITACCERFGFSQSYLAVGAPDINGTYVLDANHSTAGLCGNGDTCGYGYREFGVFDLETHSGITCGFVIGTTAQRVDITARFYDDGGGIRLWVQATIQEASGSQRMTVFLGKSDVLTNCMDVNGDVIANECGACANVTVTPNASKCYNGDDQSFGDGAGTMTVTI